jgi:hypothetical protein
MTKLTKDFVSLALLSIALLVLAETSVRAQSTIINAPSTQVVNEKDVYLEFDFISNYSHHYNGGFQTYLPRAVVGVRKKVEAGVNVSYTDGFGTDQPVEIQPNVKWQFFENESKQMAAALGCIGYIPVNHRNGTDKFALCYSVLSKGFKGSYAPRFTGGGYGLLGRKTGTGSRAGFVAGYEQPIAPRTSFVVDWLSGQNRFGYVTSGFSINTTSRSTLFSGYTIGNQGRRNNAFMTFYGIRL